MKEVPNKIYLSYETDNEDYNDHIFIDYMWHRHPFDGKNNVEYVRADAFIEETVNWLINNTDITPTGIKNYRKAMKGK